MSGAPAAHVSLPALPFWTVVSFGTIAFVAILVAFAVVARLVPLRVRLPVWILIVLYGVVPWSSWADHAHWPLVEWIPFSRTIRLRDVFLNLCLYVPIGWFVVSSRRTGGAGAPWHDRPARIVLTAATFALALSVLTELTQVFSHGRFPTMTDVVTNTSGALLGAWAAVAAARRPSGDSPPHEPR